LPDGNLSQDVIIKQQIIFYSNHEKEIPIIWLIGQFSCTIIIPKEFAKEHGFTDIKEAILEVRPEGLLINLVE
jgi:hypothetical protein